MLNVESHLPDKSAMSAWEMLCEIWIDEFLNAYEERETKINYLRKRYRMLVKKAQY